MSLSFKLLIFSLTMMALLAAPAGRAQSQNSSITVDADQYTSRPNQVAELKGNVHIVQGLQSLTCDQAVINMATQEVTAKGSVRLISPEEFISAESLQYNFKTKKGLVKNGFVQMGQETIEGEEIIKDGDTQYLAKRASYTSCINCPPAWRLTGSEIDATAGSYAYIKNPIVRIYGAPIFWLPYIVIPIKTERQSGLLPPKYAFSGDNGFTFTPAYFWAINKSKDMTFYETYYKNRGFKTGVEYRYRTDKNSGGNFFGNYINDSRYGFEPKFLTPDRRYWNQGSYNLPFENRQVENYIPRYSLHYDHHYELPHGFTNNMEVNLVRDSHYPYDFPDDILGQGNPSLENRLSIAKNFENSHASADIGVYQNLIKADPVGGNESAIHRVPELKYSLLPQHIASSDFLLSFDLNYLNLNRMDKNGQITANTSTQTVTNGSYRTGQRINARPTLKYPMVFGRYLDLVPELQYEESFYQFGYSTKPTTTRRYVRTSLLAKTRLSAVLGEPQEVKATRYKHQIEPDILYTQVPYLYQADHPFFGQIAANDTNYSSGQPITEFDNLQFDYRDRLVDRHVVTFGLTNKLVRKKWNGESVEYFEIIRHRLSQSYDIFNTYQANPADLSTADTTDVIQVIRQPWSDIRSLLNMRIDNFNLHSDVSYFPYQNVYSQSSSVGIRDDRGNGFDVGYAQRFSYARDRNNLPTKLLDLNSRSEALTFSLYLASKYLDLASVTGYNLAQGLFTSQTFSGLLKPPGECWGIEFRFKKTFGGANAEYTINLPIFFGEGRSFNTSTGSI